MAAHDNGIPNGVNGANGTAPTKPTITVLVTGFGPFQDRYPINPSYEITKRLSSTLTTAKGTHVTIIPYAPAIRVCYDEVRQLVPALHQSYAGTVDLVLHIGMASGRDYYTCEIYAHRDGYYKNKDVDGKTLPADQGLLLFPDCPPAMTTSLDVEGLIEGWRENVRFSSVPELSARATECCRPSEDAGHYLCDYIYFNSLAWFGRRSRSVAGGEVGDRPVLFLHVPAESDEVILEKGRVVTLALIEAMVESWASGTKA